MASGVIALVALAAAVVLIVLLTGLLKVHPFLALIGAAFAYGFAAGIPPAEIARNVKAGFGGIFSQIGIVIVTGSIIGSIMERTGAAHSLARAMLRVVGRKRAPLAMSVAGYFVSIPVACDSGYVILSPLNRALARESGVPAAVMAVALSTGLYATHALAPPTPGPLAAAAALGADLGRVLVIGLVAAVPAAAAGLFCALRVAGKPGLAAQAGESWSAPEEKTPGLPGAFLSFLPIGIPISLILLKSLAELPSRPLGSQGLAGIAIFLGEPVTALFAGLALSILLIPRKGMKVALNRWIAQGIRESASILVITGAGGAFGQVIRAGQLPDFIRMGMAGLEPGLQPGLILPFILAAALKTAQGSSTVAIITASAILAPMAGTLGIDPALAVVAMGAGSMLFSHANDSYFWVVSQFSGMPVDLAFRIFSPATAVQGIVAFAAVALMSLFI